MNNVLSMIGSRVVTAMSKAKDEGRVFAWTVLTDGAIFHRDKVCVGGVGDGEFLMCRVGDVVMLTNEEAEAHRVGGVDLVVTMVEAAE
jgi:hypothetical protein